MSLLSYNLKAEKPLGNLRGKSFKMAQWPEGFFVQPARTVTATWEQFVAMIFPLNEL